MRANLCSQVPKLQNFKVLCLHRSSRVKTIIIVNVHGFIRFIVHIPLAMLCSVYGYRTSEGASRSTKPGFFFNADNEPQPLLNPLNHPAKTFCKFVYCVTMHSLFGSMPRPWLLSPLVGSFKTNNQQRKKNKNDKKLKSPTAAYLSSSPF